MSESSFDFLDKVDPVFRRKIDICFISFASILEKYKTHVANSSKENIKSPSDFLEKEDFLLEMVIQDADCYESALHAMKSYAGIL